MKKTLIILAAAAIALTACNKNELVVDKSVNDEISFRTVIGGAMKSTDYHDIKASNLETFNVWALKNTATPELYFSDVDYTLIGGSGASGDPRTYTSDSKYYWPSDDTHLTFYAYSPKEATNGLTRVDTTKWNAVQQLYAKDQPDFVVAKGKGWKSNNPNGISINFRHAMSKVSVQVKNSNSGLKFKLTNWKIAYLYDKATFTLSDDETNTDTHNPGDNTANVLKPADWTYTGATQAVTTESKNGEDIAAVMFDKVTSTAESIAEFNDFIVIPQALKSAEGKYSASSENAQFNGAFIAIKMQILTDLGSEVAKEQWCCWPITTTQFNPGYHYTFKIDLADGGYYEKNLPNTDEKLDPIIMGAEIKFVDVTVDEWVPGEGTHDTAFKPFTVTLSANDDAFGTVSADKTSYNYNEVAELTATPASNYVFVNWLDGTGEVNNHIITNPRKVVMTEAKTFKAVFAKSVEVSAEPSAPADGTVGAAGTASITNVNSWETVNYQGQSITLTATPTEGKYTFTKWQVSVDDEAAADVAEGTTSPKTVVIPGNAKVKYIAVFTENTKYAITAKATQYDGAAYTDAETWGTVSVAGNVNDGASTPKYYTGSDVTLTATPVDDGHSQFKEWQKKTSDSPENWETVDGAGRIYTITAVAAAAEYRAVFTYNE